MIVKIQKPIAGNSRHPCLIYNEDRSVELFADLEHMFEEHELKIYHEAYINADKMLVIGKRVEDQEW